MVSRLIKRHQQELRLIRNGCMQVPKLVATSIFCELSQFHTEVNDFKTSTYMLSNCTHRNCCLIRTKKRKVMF